MSKQNIYNKLYEVIQNPYGVIGAMCNIKAESNFDSTNLQNSYEQKLGYSNETYTKAIDNGRYNNFVFDSAGYGLCQWTSSGRKEGLIKYSLVCGTSIGDENMQIGYLLKELSKSYNSVLTALKNATSYEQASNVFMTKFERPSDQSALAQTKRASNGIELWNELVKENVMSTTSFSKKTDNNKQISANFKAGEFKCKCSRCSTYLVDTKFVNNVLQKVRDWAGASITVNSGYRCPEHNAEVGGATQSKHMEGIAFDIVVSGKTPNEVAQFLESMNVKGIIQYTSFVHTDNRSTKYWATNSGTAKTVDTFGYVPEETTSTEVEELKAEVEELKTKNDIVTEENEVLKYKLQQINDILLL